MYFVNGLKDDKNKGNITDEDPEYLRAQFAGSFLLNECRKLLDNGELSREREMTVVKINELDVMKLGEVLLNAAPASCLADHKWLKSTLKDYVLPSSDQLEVEFVKDLFTLPSEEIAEKWYGGKQNAIAYVRNKK